MSKIFELYGYRLDHWNYEAISNRERAWCPFMDAECDGGGNRYLSALDVSKNPKLAPFFPGQMVVQSGVCSLRLHDNEQPWIICPRRLLSLKNNFSKHQSYVREQIIKYANIPRDNSHRVWSEVKIKADATNDNDEAKFFDYTFDYVIAGSTPKKLTDVAELIEKSINATQKIAEDHQYTLSLKDGEIWIDNFPSDPIYIIEIMTSSTSGGDKKKRTQIAMACEDAIITPEKHNGPGINYRQVWARMVSQLIVKSQVALAWNGRTFWLLQDLLADYISSTTALDLNRYVSQYSDEVNILSFGYNEADLSNDESLVEIQNSTFYSGPIAEHGTSIPSNGFIDIVKVGAPPSKNYLWRCLFNKTPCGTISEL